MRRPTQAQTNPFPYTDSNKRYHTYDYDLRHRYGGKCAKVVLDAGMTCPNIDGSKGSGGCIYCSSSGSGDFALPALSLREQYDRQRQNLSRKWEVQGYIPYLQAHTNTYATPQRVRAILEELLSFPDIVGISLATRADCISPQMAALLGEVAERTDLTVELGLQSVFDDTAVRINRCHTYADFLEGFARLRQAGKMRIAVHLINGLPGEDEAQMVESARRVGALGVEEIKLHLLYVLRSTPLAALYERGDYRPMEREAYVRTVVRQLEWIPPQTVIGRLTGDAPREELLAPLWSLQKFTVMNDIDRLLYVENSMQGRFLSV